MARKNDILNIYTKEVEGIKEAGLFKGEAPFVSPQGARVKMEDGRELLCMCANNYLGLGDNPRLIEAAKRTYDEKGYGVASVRFICGTQDIHKKLEKKISGFLGTDDTILYSSCFDANGGLFETILTAEDAVISDELNHASIIDGCRIARAQVTVYKHNDMQDLEQLLEEIPAAGERFIVTDGVFSMDGDIANLPELVRLKEKYGACLMVDDAHGVGVIGADGSGTAAYYNMPGTIDLQVGTLSKALAAEGGYVAASKTIIEYLINKSRPFIFSTALPACVMAAALAALRLLRQKPEQYVGRLKENAALMRRLLHEEGFEIIDGVTPIVPVLIGSSEKTMRFMAALFEAGIMVSGIRPPTVPEGTSRLRVTVTAAHTEAEIKQAAKTMGRIWRELKA